MSPPPSSKFFFAIKFWLIGLTTNQESSNFNKIENQLYVREGEGSILGTFRLKKY